MLPQEEIEKNAIPVRWDDDVIKWVYDLSCDCGGVLILLKYYRNPHLPKDPIERAELQSEGKLSTSNYDVVECECNKCNKKMFFSFVPWAIHTSLQELLLQNKQWIHVKV